MKLGTSLTWVIDHLPPSAQTAVLKGGVVVAAVVLAGKVVPNPITWC